MTLSNNTQRILFGLVAGPLFLFLLWQGGWYRDGLFTFLLGGATWEFMRILRARFPDAGREPETLLPTFAVFLSWLSANGPLTRLAGRLAEQADSALGADFVASSLNKLIAARELAMVLLVAWILLHGFRRLPRDQVFPWVSGTVVGILYLGVWGSSFYGLVGGGGGGWAKLYSFLFAMGCCWIGDSAAYFFGRAFGRHKLCPELSPGKTIEGAVAAIVSTGAFGAWMGTAFLGLAPWAAIALGAMLGGAAILGDLAESVLKRWADVKDSSRIFPGHGGILDRFDSLFLVAPVLLAILHAARGLH